MQSTSINNVPQAKNSEQQLIQNISRTKRADTAAAITNSSIDNEAPWRTYGMFKDTCMENSILFNKLARILTHPQAHAKLLQEKNQVDLQASKNLLIRTSQRTMQYAKIQKENRQLFLRFADCKPSVLNSTQMAQGYEKHKEMQMRITRFPSNHKRHSSLPYLRPGLTTESNTLEGDNNDIIIKRIPVSSQEGRTYQNTNLQDIAKQKYIQNDQNQMKLKTEQYNDDGYQKYQQNQIFPKRIRSLSHSSGCQKLLFSVQEPKEQTEQLNKRPSPIPHIIDEELFKDKTIQPIYQSKESKWQNLIIKRDPSHQGKLLSCNDQKAIQQIIQTKQLKDNYIPVLKSQRSSNGNNSKILQETSMNGFINLKKQNAGFKKIIS